VRSLTARPGWLRFPVGWTSGRAQLAPTGLQRNFGDFLRRLHVRSSTARPGWLRFPVGWTSGRAQLAPTGLQRGLGPGDDCRGGLRPPARACYVILGNGQAAGRRVLEVAPTASDVMPFVWRPIAGRPYGLAGSIWISDKLGPGIEKGS
jgi:hypothetical protein